MNVVNQDDYGSYDFTFKSDARKFECGSYTVATLLSLKAAVELLLEVGIDAIAERIKHLTDRLIAGSESKGYNIISPRENDQWSGIVSFTSPTGDHMKIWQQLRQTHKTEIALREGRLRVSPHFYNTDEQIDRLIARLPGH